MSQWSESHSDPQNELCPADQRLLAELAEVECRSIDVGEIFGVAPFELRLEKQVVGLHVSRRRGRSSQSNAPVSNDRLKLAANFSGDFVVQEEDVRQLASVALRPTVKCARRLDQLCGDSNLITSDTHATFQHVFHTQALPDLSNRYSIGIERKR